MSVTKQVVGKDVFWIEAGFAFKDDEHVWKEKFDKKTERNFYVNQKTHDKKWVLPGQDKPKKKKDAGDKKDKKDKEKSKEKDAGEKKEKKEKKERKLDDAADGSSPKSKEKKEKKSKEKDAGEKKDKKEKKAAAASADGEGSSPSPKKEKKASKEKSDQPKSKEKKLDDSTSAADGSSPKSKEKKEKKKKLEDGGANSPTSPSSPEGSSKSKEKKDKKKKAKSSSPDRASSAIKNKEPDLSFANAFAVPKSAASTFDPFALPAGASSALNRDESEEDDGDALHDGGDDGFPSRRRAPSYDPFLGQPAETTATGFASMYSNSNAAMDEAVDENDGGGNGHYDMYSSHQQQQDPLSSFNTASVVPVSDEFAPDEHPLPANPPAASYVVAPSFTAAATDPNPVTSQPDDEFAPTAAAIGQGAQSPSPSLNPAASPSPPLLPPVSSSSYMYSPDEELSPSPPPPPQEKEEAATSPSPGPPSMMGEGSSSPPGNREGSAMAILEELVRSSPEEPKKKKKPATASSRRSPPRSSADDEDEPSAVPPSAASGPPLPSSEKMKKAESPPVGLRATPESMYGASGGGTPSGSNAPPLQTHEGGWEAASSSGVPSVESRPPPPRSSGKPTGGPRSISSFATGAEHHPGGSTAAASATPSAAAAAASSSEIGITQNDERYEDLSAAEVKELREELARAKRSGAVGGPPQSHHHLNLDHTSAQQRRPLVSFTVDDGVEGPSVTEDAEGTLQERLQARVSATTSGVGVGQTAATVVGSGGGTIAANSDYGGASSSLTGGAYGRGALSPVGLSALDVDMQDEFANFCHAYDSAARPELDDPLVNAPMHPATIEKIEALQSAETYRPPDPVPFEELSQLRLRNLPERQAPLATDAYSSGVHGRLDDVAKASVLAGMSGAERAFYDRLQSQYDALGSKIEDDRRRLDELPPMDLTEEGSSTLLLRQKQLRHQREIHQREVQKTEQVVWEYFAMELDQGTADVGLIESLTF